ncbi:hypothetical protein ACQPXM_00100 [Kribbella sp. CA-253562]|uniref:hypothetical protein n=1 Tax=Kribbella sp. CA-253562 TaxID=3239942 RepID=UPI003D8E3A57
MGPPAFVIVLVIALIISAQLSMMLDRSRTLSQRLRDLGGSGDAFGLHYIAMLMLGATGALFGSLLSHPGPGAATGLALALLTWLAAVVLAHRNPPGPGKHASS